LAVIEVSRDTAAVEAFLGMLRLVLFGAGGLALAAALIASVLVARQITQPLRQMEATTRAIASGDFDQRLSVTSVDEIGRLAASINWMASDLARLEATRRDFMAKVSHDLRTPLTAIKGFVVNLQDTAPEEMQASLATVDEQTDRLIRLVNDLLTASRLQRGALSLHLTQVDLVTVVRSATATASERARRMGIALNLELPERLPPVEGDADRLEQVLVNLLDNAIRATPAGGTVRIHLSSSPSEVLATIIDNGRGLTEEEEARAFEPYFHGPGGGTGLGLTIAREIIEAHGGRIWLRGRSEAGAEVGLGLPRS
jgi:signal transduction histidine kinase